MNKTILYTAMLTILCSSGYAADASPPTATSTTQAPVVGSPKADVLQALPEAMPSKNSTDATSQSTTTIDCKYKIPASTTSIDEATVKTWAQSAAIQSFNFSPPTVDDELGSLKNCYTDQGWQGFNEALQKSGNITAIKSQNLTVSSQVDGDLKLNDIKDNQWKVTVPLQVVYQNDKEKLTQLLTVDLLIGRKISGDLGIIQMIAAPRDPIDKGTQGETTSPTATPSTPTPSEAPVTTSPAATTSPETNAPASAPSAAPASPAAPAAPASPSAPSSEGVKQMTTEPPKPFADTPSPKTSNQQSEPSTQTSPAQ